MSVSGRVLAAVALAGRGRRSLAKAATGAGSFSRISVRRESPPAVSDTSITASPAVTHMTPSGQRESDTTRTNVTRTPSELADWPGASVKVTGPGRVGPAPQEESEVTETKNEITEGRIEITEKSKGARPRGNDDVFTGMLLRVLTALLRIL
jgi:hypothetical protein